MKNYYEKLLKAEKALEELVEVIGGETPLFSACLGAAVEIRKEVELREASMPATADIIRRIRAATESLHHFVKQTCRTKREVVAEVAYQMSACSDESPRN